MTTQEMVQACADLLKPLCESDTSVLPMLYPLVNLNWGLDKSEKNEILSVYQQSWGESAGNLPWLTGESSTDDQIIDAALSQNNGKTNLQERYNDVWIVHYVDPLQIDLNKLESRLQNRPDIGGWIQANVIVCVFCTQVGNEQSRTATKRVIERLDTLTDKVSVVLLSKAPGRRMLEDARIAALIAVCTISNATFSFQMKNCQLVTPGYFCLEKQTEQTARLILAEMIRMYLNREHEQTTLRRTLCGSVDDYGSLFANLFQEKIVPLIPRETGFWTSLPWTEAVEKLDTELNRHVWRNKTTVSETLKEAALSSIADIWKACVARYYSNPVEQWFDSTGKNQLEMEFSAKLANQEASYALRLDQESFLQEMERLEITPYNKKEPLDRFFHGCALEDLRKQCYDHFRDCILNVLDQFFQNGGSKFRERLTALLHELEQERTDNDNMQNAYRDFLAWLCGKPGNEKILFGAISPCYPSQICNQLIHAFRGITELSPERFKSDLMEELQFISNGYEPDLGEMLNVDLSKLLRIRTGDDREQVFACTLIHAEYANQLGGQIHRVPWRDRIIKLGIFRVTPKNISD